MENRENKAFTSDHERDRFVQMPLECRNAPRTFRRTRDVTLLAVKWQLASAYLNDIFIFSYSAAEPIHHIEPLLVLTRDEGVTLKLKECKFVRKTVNG